MRAQTAPFPQRTPIARASILALWFLFGCAAPPASESKRFDFFSQQGAAGPDDPWFPKVEEWQGRAQREGTRLARTDRGSSRSAERSGQLQHIMSAYRDERRREVASAVVEWSQRQVHCRDERDPVGDAPARDHWPTVGDLHANEGNACEGLDLVVYQTLREFGFPRDQLFRGILRRDRDRADHMVTLWFEDRADPWVLDATGAASARLHRLSEMPGWTATKVFNETTQFGVVERETRGSTPVGE